jgi:hypothetical protein
MMNAATKAQPCVESSVRVSCDGRGEIGVLVFDLKNRKLLRGAKALPPAVVLLVMHRFTKQDDLFGNFQHHGHTFRFKDLALESSPKKKAV